MLVLSFNMIKKSSERLLLFNCTLKSFQIHSTGWVTLLCDSLMVLKNSHFICRQHKSCFNYTVTRKFTFHKRSAVWLEQEKVAACVCYKPTVLVLYW